MTSLEKAPSKTNANSPSSMVANYFIKAHHNHSAPINEFWRVFTHMQFNFGLLRPWSPRAWATNELEMPAPQMPNHILWKTRFFFGTVSLARPFPRVSLIFCPRNAHHQFGDLWSLIFFSMFLFNILDVDLLLSVKSTFPFYGKTNTCSLMCCELSKKQKTCKGGDLFRGDHISEFTRNYEIYISSSILDQIRLFVNEMGCPMI